MRLTFRQGLVRVQQPTFLQTSGSYVNLLANTTPTTATVSHGSSEYLITEPRNVSNAWGPFTLGSDYWLYWDIHPITGQRTFGHTTVLPVHSSTAPTSPANDQHWFDTSITTMKVWNATSNTWVKKIRVFATKYQNGSILVPYSVGTQVAINTPTLSGTILFDGNGKPVKKPSSEFFTTEDSFFINGLATRETKLESANVSAIAQENMGAFQVVYFSSLGKINIASYNQIGDELIAITTHSAVTDEVVNLVTQGVVTNTSWNWPTVGVELWALNGVLTTVDPHVSNPGTYPTAAAPIARVLSADTILFEQGLGGIGDTGPVGPAGIVVDASTTAKGVSKLSVAPVSATSPISCGDNDPRLTDARTPTTHVHTATSVTSVPTGAISATNVQSAIAELDTEKLSLAGGTMTGALTLSGAPTSALHATPKSYVDGLVSGLVWISPITQHVNLISDSLNTPPITPETSDVYIVAAGGTGAWSGLDAKLVRWNGSTWDDLGLFSALTGTIRFGIAMESTSTPSGTFVGRKNQIGIYSAGWTFYVPTTNNAVYVSNPDSLHAFHQYAFSGTAWIEFGGTSTVGGISEPLNQVVIGTGTGTSSSPQFTYDPTNGDLLIDYVWVPTPGDVQIFAPSSSSAAGGGNVDIWSGDSDQGDAGPIWLRGGGGGVNGIGGNINLIAGGGAGVGDGGLVQIFGGSAASTGSGGSITITGGIGLSGGGGFIGITSGHSNGGDGSGGTLNLSSGYGNGVGNGGNILIQSGAGGTTTTGSGGALTIISGASTSTAGTSGSVSVAAGSASNGSNAGNVSISGGLAVGGGTSGYVSVFTNGIEALRVIKEQRVLIGTTTDDTVNKLQVNGQITVDADPTTALQVATKQYVDYYAPTYISGSTFSIPSSSDILMIFVVPRDMEIPADFAGSEARSLVASTGTAIYTIKRNGSNIGTITYATDVYGSFADDTEIGTHTLSIGDIVTVVAPASPDATHNQLGWSIFVNMVIAF